MILAVLMVVVGEAWNPCFLALAVAPGSYLYAYGWVLRTPDAQLGGASDAEWHQRSGDEPAPAQAP